MDLSKGQRVQVLAFGETPMDALVESVVLEDQAPPDPSTLSATDVVVGVKSAAVGWVDLLMSSGQYQHQVKPPYTPGLEYSGEVLWVGDAVRSVAVGERVMADGLLTGPRSLGAHQGYGGFASWALAPEEALYPLPAGWSFDQGCNFFGNYETAWHCLFARGQLKAGEVILIHGATGSTGLAAVHLAKLIGATVIATGRSAQKLAEVKAQGADHVVQTADEAGNYRSFKDEVRSLTQGQGADVVYDSVGGQISLETLRCVRFGARFLLVGWAATPFVAKGRGQRGAPNANQLPTNLILIKGLDVLGCPTAISTHRDPKLRVPRLEQLLGWAGEGRLRPHSGKAYALADYVEAMRAKWESRFVGGCVLHP